MTGRGYFFELMKGHPLLEKHKRLFAQARGYKTWNEYKLQRSAKECIRDVYEIATNAILELENNGKMDLP